MSPEAAATASCRVGNVWLQGVAAGMLTQNTEAAAWAGAAAVSGRTGTTRAPSRRARRGRTRRMYVEKSTGGRQHAAQELPGALLVRGHQQPRRRSLLQDPATVEEAD